VAPAQQYVPSTIVRTTHSITIKVNGQTIGMINGWTPAQSRTITPIFELDISGSGNPVECMPGNIGGLTMAVNRYDIYTKRMEETFGTPDLVMLTRQSEPFVITEIWNIPGTTDQERYLYNGCWFSSIGRNLRSDDTRIVNVNASIMYTTKQKVTGIFGKAIEAISKQNWNLPGL